MSNKSLVISGDAKKRFDSLLPTYHPLQIKHEALIEISKIKNAKKRAIDPNSSITQAMSTKEFDLGLLMNMGIPEVMRTFAIDYSLKLQKQYECVGPAEQSLSELVALNYCRVMVLQKRMNNCLDDDKYPDKHNKHLDLLSKEMDRAQRHYMSALQTLKAMKMPAITFNVKTDMANLAYQQVVQGETKKDAI
jgi:hypothetical protein